jgi:peptidoglycan/xylan/chitin deacetylase (PgdA/CDA1 family)
MLPKIIPPVSNDYREPSRDIPGGLKAEDCPQFVVIGFDDNGVSANIEWFLDAVKEKQNPKGKGNKKTFDGTNIQVSFYMLGSHGLGMLSWKKAFDYGHEVGVHTYNHPHGVTLVDGQTKPALDYEGHQAEIQKCIIELERLGINRAFIKGYRQPYLEYTMHSLVAAALEGFLYDCSIEEGATEDEDGTNFLWPYTLDNGSPGNNYFFPEGDAQHIGQIKGLWEIPVYHFIVPDLEAAKKFDLKDEEGNYYSLKEKIGTDRITGFDYNLWVLYGLNGKEFSTTLKYNLDLRLEGNRCPFTFGAHSDEYGAELAYRREALVDFIDYALTKPDVRIQSAANLLEWLRKPAKL